MSLVDTHCHIHEITASSDNNDQTAAVWAALGSRTADELIAQARKQGVTDLICVGTTAADSRLATRFVQHRDHCWASVGIHPHEAREGTAGMSVLQHLLERRTPKIVAIGECGLDYFYQHTEPQQQIELLHAHIQLALKYNLPLIFHVREAFDDFWPIFDSYHGLRGVLHSFTDTHHNLEKAVSRGLYIGVNGIATFTKVAEQREVFRAIPLQNLLLETDAPFLTPVPLRGKVNEPAFVTLVAEYLANLRSIHLEELSAATSQNATQLFLFQTNS